MADGPDHKLIYMTAADTAQARAICEALVAERLVACANLLGPIQSVYWWDGAVQHGDEVAVVMKTRTALVDQVSARIAELHDYDCPCVVAVDITGGHGPFLDWISAETGGE